MIDHSNPYPEKRNWSLEEHQAWPKLYLTLAERDYVQKQTKRAELIRDFKQRPRKGLVRWPEVFLPATHQCLKSRYHDGYSGQNVVS